MIPMTQRETNNTLFLSEPNNQKFYYALVRNIVKLILLILLQEKCLNIAKRTLGVRDTFGYIKDIIIKINYFCRHVLFPLLLLPILLRCPLVRLTVLIDFNPIIFHYPHQAIK